MKFSTKTSSVLLMIILFIVISGCTSMTEPPGDFETGEETTPPLGCIEYKTRGGDC